MFSAGLEMSQRFKDCRNDTHEMERKEESFREKYSSQTYGGTKDDQNRTADGRNNNPASAQSTSPPIDPNLAI